MTNSAASQAYWDDITDLYQQETTISLDDFHYGPLVPGDNALQLLPKKVNGLNCLEIGCGASQNSIFLAKAGAHCTALDISEKQINHGRQLAKDTNTSVSFICADMDDMPQLPQTSFDILHSAYALPFSSDPKAFINNAADLVAPGGMLLLSTGHPLFAAEWLKLDDEGCGAFVQDYFNPPVDSRVRQDGTVVSSRTYPVSRIANWIIESGLGITRILEPAPAKGHAPYSSTAWERLRPQLENIPVVAIYAAKRPR